MKLILILRSILVTFLLGPLSTFSHCFAAIICGSVFHSRNAIDRVNLSFAKSLCFLYGVRVTVSGLENIPEGGGIYLFNHTSFFDIMALYSHFPFLRFGAKIELFKIPLWGGAMRAMGTLPIARSNREAAIRVLKEACVRARQGERFALSPEGGRSQEGRLLPFKAGPFLFAIEAGVPLVPITINGAQRVWPKGSFFPGTESFFYEIHMKVLPAVSTIGKTIEQRTELQQVVRAEMAEALGVPL